MLQMHSLWQALSLFLGFGGSGDILFGIAISRVVVTFSGILFSEELVGQVFCQSKPFLTFNGKPFFFVLNNFTIFSALKFCRGIDTVLPLKVIPTSWYIIIIIVFTLKKSYKIFLRNQKNYVNFLPLFRDRNGKCLMSFQNLMS